MRIILTVTNDLSYDQRMHRIGESLAENGHAVTLVGRVLPASQALEPRPFGQKRMRCFFRKGVLFYAEYNLRLFLFLLQAPFDAVCSIDLDTLPAGCLASLLRGKKRVFDAHEYFTEVPEVVNRPFVRLFWELVARACLPFYKHAYTVGPALAKIFEEKYGLKFAVVRNVPNSIQAEPTSTAPKLALGEKYLLYQGALNEGRGIEAMLEAMRYLEDVKFLLAGEGDLSSQLRQRSLDLGLEDRVTFLGYVKPRDLKQLTAQAWLGLNLLENRGLSYYYSLANKFFDSVQANVPVLTMDFPEYRQLNQQFKVAILLPDLQPDTIVKSVQALQEQDRLYDELKQNCLLAKQEWCWEAEQRTLLDIWKQVEA